MIQSYISSRSSVGLHGEELHSEEPSSITKHHSGYHLVMVFKLGKSTVNHEWSAIPLVDIRFCMQQLLDIHGSPEVNWVELMEELEQLKNQI